jgi:filamentous hemagglutinin
VRFVPYRFRNARKRARHFSDHCTDFGATTEAEYEQMADGFLNCPLPPDCEERVRPRDGATIRFNRITEEFGILSADGYLRTYYIPDPAIHGEATNYDYYLNQ